MTKCEDGHRPIIYDENDEDENGILNVCPVCEAGAEVKRQFEEDPLKEIREAYKQYKPMIEDFKGSDLKLSGFPFIEGFIGLWIAISETIKIVGEVENET